MMFVTRDMEALQQSGGATCRWDHGTRSALFLTSSSQSCNTQRGTNPLGSAGLSPGVQLGQHSRPLDSQNSGPAAPASCLRCRATGTAPRPELAVTPNTVGSGDITQPFT